VNVPPVGVVKDNLVVQDVLDVALIGNPQNLNQWRLNHDLSAKNSKIAKPEKKEVEVKASLLMRANHDLHVERKVSRTMNENTQKEAADELKDAVKLINI